MNTDSLNQPQDLTRPDHEKFYNFLLQKAEASGYGESKKHHWVQYMMDTSRAKEIVTSLLAYFNITHPETYNVLDVGCGFGGLMMALQPYFAKVCGIDIEMDRVEWSNQRAPGSEAVCASATQLPWPDQEFNLVISTDVFEHISYDDQKIAAAELMRVLKPGGYGYVEVPNRFQILDEHNRVFFGTWLPDSIREMYVNLMPTTHDYVQCWERTGNGWKRLFEDQGFEVNLQPRFLKGLTLLKYFLIPPNRYKLYLKKV